MIDGDGSDEPALTAGDFSSWLTEIQAALRGDRGSDVPCDGCTACCTSAQFVHIGPDETDTLTHIPAELLFPAPRLPRGHVLLGYDERGWCPMLGDGGCSIYAHRPRACRTYDCRVFPAAGLEVDDGKVAIARRASRWTFSFPTPDDRMQHDAVRAAAAFLRDHPAVIEGGIPANASGLAVMAIEVHRAFLRNDEETGRATLADPDPDAVRAEVMRRRGQSDGPRR